jgi:multidrug efflux pump
MILWSVPLALARGAGSKIRIHSGTVIVGGMTVGTLFTVFVVSVVYTYMAGAKRKQKLVTV